MPQSDSRRSRILIADDDAVIRDVLEEFLCERYDCAAVASAETALTLLEAERFNLIVTDISMGAMSGIELVRHVHERSPETVIVIISGSQNLESAIASMRAGAFDYLPKPFDLEHVDVAVRRALQHQGLLEAKREYECHLQELVERRTSELNRALGTLESSYRATLKALTSALDTRDKETAGHSERVVNFSLRLGRELGLSAKEMRALEYGALLHDIGKIGVPDAILRKPARLTEEEWTKMRLHPLIGKKILSGINFLEGAASVVAQHHEKWDGSGYPLGLKGEEIDLKARIFAVADAFDAITSERVYKSGRTHETARHELERCSGTHFDPAVVEAFNRVPAGEWVSLSGREPAATRTVVGAPTEAALTVPA